MPYTLIATAPFGLEAVVARELRELQFRDILTENGEVRFAADAAGVARSNLWLRAADRVQLLVGRFPARTFEELFTGVRALPWEELLPRDARFPVSGKSIESKLHSVPACQSVAKKAVVERLCEQYGQQSFPESGAEYAIEVALRKDTATVTLDTSGPGLHKRGYRVRGGTAPVKETLAAALVLLSRWDAARPFADPMCGTGTIAIEAALYARRLAPGLRRGFASESFPWVGEKVYSSARKEAAELARPSSAACVAARDVDPGAVRAAEENADKAGVLRDLSLQAGDVRDFSPRLEYGCLVTNPPYGERMDAPGAARGAHDSLARALDRIPTWSAFILTTDRDWERRLGRTADRRRKLYNGRIECQLYQHFGPFPPRDSGQPPVGAPGGCP